MTVTCHVVRETPCPPPVKEVVLTMDEDTALDLLAIIGRIGGAPFSPIRESTSVIYDAIREYYPARDYESGLERIKTRSVPSIEIERHYPLRLVLGSSL